VIYRDSLENVVGSLCSLFFIGQYIVACVLLPAELLSVGKSWQGFLVSILKKNSGKQFIGLWFHFKDRVLLLAYKQQACYAVRRYDSKYRRSQKSFRTYTASATCLRLNCYVFFKKIKHTHVSVQVCGRPFLTFV